MTAFWVLFLAGAVTLAAGRFHGLFRETDSAGHNYPTTASLWLRWGSLMLAMMLWLAAVIAFGLRSR